VFAINADGTDESLVVDFARNASWSADGLTIIAAINGEIGATNPDGSDSRILTNRVGRPILRQGPMPSPDGLSIIFAETTFFLMDIDGSNVRPFGPDGGLSGVTTTFGSGATWSPDGTRIAFHAHLSPDGIPQSSLAGGPIDIFVIDADGQNMVNLTNSASSNDNWPTWSPDGSRIAFGSSRDVLFGSDIYIMDADGSNLVQITDAEGFELSPAWSPR
jgi:TolB protein